MRARTRTEDGYPNGKRYFIFNYMYPLAYVLFKPSVACFLTTSKQKLSRKLLLLILLIKEGLLWGGKCQLWAI